jgi:hypothetical protein
VHALLAGVLGSAQMATQSYRHSIDVDELRSVAVAEFRSWLEHEREHFGPSEERA